MHMLTTAEVAVILGVKPYTVATWCLTGKIKASKSPGGRDWRIPEAEVGRGSCLRCQAAAEVEVA